MKKIRCPRCRKMYEFDGYPPPCCPECLSKEEETYLRVREFVKMHPGVKLITVSQMLDVPESKIMQYLREERLEIVSTSTSFLRCQVCGKTINTGIYCDIHRTY